MSGMIEDVLTGELKPDVVNAACNAAGKMLKMIEMQMQYASREDRDLLQVTSKK